jgi:hypothetical protein
MEVKFNEIQKEIETINHRRTVSWTKHDMKCEFCMHNLKDMINTSINEWHSTPTKMPFVSFLKYYWIYITFGIIVFSAFFHLEETIVTLAYKLIFGIAK